jgi:TolA-binding protein
MRYVINEQKKGIMNSIILRIYFIFISWIAPGAIIIALEHPADDLFDAGLYEESVQMYRKELSAAPEDAHLRERLAKAYLLTGQYREVIALLNPPKSAHPEEHFLLGLAFQKSGKQGQAISAFTDYLAKPSVESLPHYHQARFELGKSFFLDERPGDARKHLSAVAQQKVPEHWQHLARLYLAQIKLSENDYVGAMGDLKALKNELPGKDALNYEAAYFLGEASFQLRNYAQAADFFEQALPHHNPDRAAWHADTLYHLGWSYLKMGEELPAGSDSQRKNIERAAGIFEKLLNDQPEEKVALALGQCYLAKAARLKDVLSYQQTDRLLSRQDLIVSREGQAHALLLRAEAASTYEARDLLYRSLTQELNRDTPWYAKGWYLRGINDFEEGLNQEKAGQSSEAMQAFEHATAALKQAAMLLQPVDHACAGLALKYQAEAAFHQKTHDKYEQALAALGLLLSDADLLTAMRHRDEIYYLKAMVAFHLAETEDRNDLLPMAETCLQEGVAGSPQGKYADSSLLLLGQLYYRQKQYGKAEETFLKLQARLPDSPLAGESLYWAARSAESQNDPIKRKNYLQNVFDQYPHSFYAPEAYFSYYTYQEYLQGDRGAVKHLQIFTEEYPKSPFAIHAWYLIGLDYKRDRKTAEGKWIRKKSLTAAIDAFHEAETIFDSLFNEGAISEKDLELLATLRYRAALERALANLAIADESQSAKRQIFLQYAQDLFKQIGADFKDSKNPLHRVLNRHPDSAHIYDEASYWLAQAYIKGNDDAAAEQILSLMLEKYRSAKITKGYLLSRTWYEKGLMEMRRQQYTQAMQSLVAAEDAAKGKVLSSDQKVDLWIQQSLCQQSLGQIDQAILILSKAINDDAISSLRIKAMYLRAEAYEKLGRSELARRQLEATAKKGGEWSQKAQEKLVTDYGH